MNFLLEFLLELLIQIVSQLLFELGLHAIAEPFRTPPNPWLAAIGYGIFGLIFGGISLWLFSRHLVTTTYLRWASVFVTPVAMGGCMSLIGVWRASRGGRVLRIDRFFFGYLFALAFALVRFKWAA